MKLPSRFHRIHRFFLAVFLLPLTIQAQSVRTQTESTGVSTAAVPVGIPPSTATANLNISITASQRLIQPMGGKLPSSMSLAVFEGDCDSSKGTPLNPNPSYKLIVTGSGITITQQTPSKCMILASLAIDLNTPPGVYSILLLDGTGAPAASTELTVMSASAGAIPPGLPPEVDVMWEVMSQNNCADVFGTRVAVSLYCIQLKIGNNSGHPLQLAGIGFTNRLKELIALGGPYVTLANSSYASTRAVLLHQEMWSTRNVLYHSLEAAGLLMAGFTPFFARPTPKAHFATAASIVSGPLLQAFNIIAPDPILSQLNNLDDQSFRDNMVIPNNAQIQTVVFIEKQALTDALRNLKIQLTSAASNAKQIAETKDGAITPAARELAAVKSEVLTEMAGDTAVSIQNSKRPWSPFAKGNQDPLFVKLALGSVVIVGQEIEYLQRVQVQSNASGALAGAVAISPPTVSLAISTAVTPSTQQFTATVVNDQNNAGVTWTLSGANCLAAACGTLTNPAATTVTYTAPSAQPVPNNAVTLTATSKADATKSGTATIAITPLPILVTMAPKPAPAIAQGGPGTLFNAAVSNDPTGAGVAWSLSGTGCAGVNCGTLTLITPSSVTYTPPSAKPNPNTVTLAATSNSDPTKRDSVVITIN